MGAVQLTEKEMVALMIVKALDDFETSDPEDNTLDYKIRAFDIDVDEEGISMEEFDKALNKFDQFGIFDASNESEYVFTLKGKALMVALSAMEKLTDEVKRGIINGTIKAVDFVKENKSEIITILIAVWQQYS